MGPFLGDILELIWVPDSKDLGPMALGFQCHGPPLWSTAAHGGGGTPQRAVPGRQGKFNAETTKPFVGWLVHHR